ncbi:hypothetical protein H4CHR_03418 [Variovorax sp. PBS-H4]|nr:hypothetical protein H4CHR_03418 [Variovorax sp. PBS-H4]
MYEDMSGHFVFSLELSDKPTGAGTQLGLGGLRHFLDNRSRSKPFNQRQNSLAACVCALWEFT